VKTTVRELLRVVIGSPRAGICCARRAERRRFLPVLVAAVPSFDGSDRRQKLLQGEGEMDQEAQLGGGHERCPLHNAKWATRRPRPPSNRKTPTTTTKIETGLTRGIERGVCIIEPNSAARTKVRQLKGAPH
jgi:hypothetical protein